MAAVLPLPFAVIVRRSRRAQCARPRCPRRHPQHTACFTAPAHPRPSSPSTPRAACASTHPLRTSHLVDTLPLPRLPTGKTSSSASPPSLAPRRGVLAAPRYDDERDDNYERDNSATACQRALPPPDVTTMDDDGRDVVMCSPPASHSPLFTANRDRHALSFRREGTTVTATMS